MNMNTKQDLYINKQIERQNIEEKIEKNAALLIQQRKVNRIDSFTGYFEFLHNNFMTPVYFEGSLYPSVTHAYHASRSSDENTRKAIINSDSFFTVAKIAGRIEDPENWSVKKISMMERLVRDKFRRSKELLEKLKATEQRELIMTYEDSTHGNLFWGMVKGNGQNQLGRILMKIRDDLNNNLEVINWIKTNFELIYDHNFLPEISLVVNKNNCQIEHIALKNKPFYKLGNLEENDVVLAHPSVSRLHACIICDKNLGVVLVDLRSKAGTRLDGDVIRDHIPYRLKDGKKLNFAMSTRDYIVSIDLSKIKKVYEREKIKLEENLNNIKEINDKSKKENFIKKSLNLDSNENETVFINNIPSNATLDGIKALFEDQFGKVKNIHWPNDRETGYKKQFAFVQFESLESAKEAVDYGIIGYDDENANENEFENFEINDNKIKNRMIKIKFAEKDRFIPKFDKFPQRKKSNSYDRRSKERKLRRKRSRESRDSRSRKDNKHRSNHKRHNRKKSISSDDSSSSFNSSDSKSSYSDSDNESSSGSRSSSTEKVKKNSKQRQ